MREPQRRPGKHPAELRERTVRTVLEVKGHCASQWEAICSVAEKVGPTPETVRKWVRRHEIDNGGRAGISTEERDRLKALERENRELRRANEILKAASSAASAPLPCGWPANTAPLGPTRPAQLPSLRRPHRAQGLLQERRQDAHRLPLPAAKDPACEPVKKITAHTTTGPLSPTRAPPRPTRR
jgi:transposase